MNRIQLPSTVPGFNRAGLAALLILTFLITWTVHSLQPPPATNGSTTTATPTAKDPIMTATPLPAIVAAALDAANAHDTDAWLAAFNPNGAVNDWGRIFTGHQAIRAWSDAEFIGVDVTLHVTQVHTTGDSTTVLAQVGGNGFNGPSHFTFTVQGDQITLMRITA
ncbi:nuclear transport factor 2 family protein [Streptomyces sp. NPDC102259]|uniref:nuclear transport factor 2 family protein n=1 Tax=Streptomyces sp. NPDC102259 TaxID=3366148 RepID=UPI003802768B